MIEKSLPLVTVVIPTHRRPAWLAEALDSVADQAYAPLQVIVVEDGADPGTKDVVARAKLPVEHHAVAHCGRPGVVRNWGLKHAAGAFVAFLDDDDRWERGKLARQVHQLLEHGQAPATYTNARLEYPGGRSGEATPPPRAARLSTRSALLGGCFIYPSTVLARRDALTVAGSFDETRRFAEDYGLWLRLSRQGNFLHSDEPLVTMRRNGTNISSAPKDEIWKDTIGVLSAELADSELTLRDRMRVRRVLAIGFAALGRALPPSSPERRRYLWNAFRLSPIASQLSWVREWQRQLRARQRA